MEHGSLFRYSPAGSWRADGSVACDVPAGGLGLSAGGRAAGGSSRRGKQLAPRVAHGTCLGPGRLRRATLPAAVRLGLHALAWRLLHLGLRILAAGAGASLLATGPAQAGSLQLSWVDNSGGTAGFKVERRPATEPAFSLVGTQVPGVTTYTDAAVAQGVTYCYRVRAYNEVGESEPSEEACGSLPDAFSVTVVLGGTGSGTVTSSPAGIACGSDCGESYPSGTVVTLTAAAASGSVFAGWSGGGCAGTDPCTLTGNSAVTVTASFDPAPTTGDSTASSGGTTSDGTTTGPTTYTLTVSRSGPGLVSSTPAGITCGKDCSQAYSAGTTVTLTATPKPGWTFVGWGGACSGTGSCTLTLTADTAVSARFARQRAAR